MEAKPKHGRLLLLVVSLALLWHVTAIAHPSDLRWYYLLDEADSLSADAALAADLGTAWRPLSRADANFGFTRAAYWFRIPFPAALPAPSVLIIDNPHLDQLDFFQFHGGTLVSHHRGGSLQQPPDGFGTEMSISFPLQPVNGPSEVLLRVQTGGVLRVPIRIWTNIGFLRDQQDRLIRWAAAFGGMLVLAAAHLAMFGRSRRKIHLSLSALIVVSAMFYACLSGFLYQMWWPDSLISQPKGVPLFAAIGIGMFGVTLFGLSTLVDRPGPRTRSALWAWLALSAGSAVAALVLPHWVSLRLIVPIGLVAITFGIGVGMLIWARGSYRTKAIAVAWQFFCAMVLLLAVAELGIPWGLVRVLDLQPLPVVAALGLLSLSVFLREQYALSLLLTRQAEAIRRLRAARAPQSAGAALTALEQRLRDRERELDMLRAELARLTESGATAAGTIESREVFDRLYRTEWRRAYRTRTMLSLILFEIDGFDALADSYGEASAERCMQQLAIAIQDHFRRPADLLARFSRSSFIVLTPSTSREDALKLAEAVRVAIAKSSIEVNGLRRGLSVSAGIASMIPDARHHDAVLLSFADDALYQAHAAGGNRVVCYQLPAPAVQGER